MGRINIQFLLTMRMPNGIPPGIKAELFEKVQKRMDSKKIRSGKRKSEYKLSFNTKLFKCGATIAADRILSEPVLSFIIAVADSFKLFYKHGFVQT